MSQRPPDFDRFKDKDRSIDVPDFVVRMKENARLMQLYAGTKWYNEVLPDGRQHFDWHAFPVNIISNRRWWMVNDDLIVRLKQNRVFVENHVQTMVNWLNACGFSVLECKFVRPGRALGPKNLSDRGNLHGNPRVAKFIHSLYLFSHVGKPASFGVPQEFNEAYRAIEMATCVFLGESGFYGSYGRQDGGAKVKYIKPGRFMVEAGLVGSDIDSYEKNASEGKTLHVPLPDLAAIKRCMDRLGISEVMSEDVDSPNRPGRGGRGSGRVGGIETEEGKDGWSFLDIGITMGVSLLCLFVALQVIRGLRG